MRATRSCSRVGRCGQWFTGTARAVCTELSSDAAIGDVAAQLARQYPEVRGDLPYARVFVQAAQETYALAAAALGGMLTLVVHHPASRTMIVQPAPITSTITVTASPTTTTETATVDIRA
jgi:hypothetical protein